MRSMKSPQKKQGISHARNGVLPFLFELFEETTFDKKYVRLADVVVNFVVNFRLDNKSLCGFGRLCATGREGVARAWRLLTASRFIHSTG